MCIEKISHIFIASVNLYSFHNIFFLVPAFVICLGFCLFLFFCFVLFILLLSQYLFPSQQPYSPDLGSNQDYLLQPAFQGTVNDAGM